MRHGVPVHTYIHTYEHTHAGTYRHNMRALYYTRLFFTDSDTASTTDNHLFSQQGHSVSLRVLNGEYAFRECQVTIWELPQQRDMECVCLCVCVCVGGREG